MLYVDGRYWGTDVEIAKALGQRVTPGKVRRVTPAMVRRWHDRKGLTKADGRYPLDQAAAIDEDVKKSRRGRPRQVDLDPALV